MSIYIFSLNDIGIKINQEEKEISKNTILKLESNDVCDLLVWSKNGGNVYKVSLNEPTYNSNIKINTINQNCFIEVISTNNNLLNKINTNNSEIEIYNDHVSIIVGTKLYSYYFLGKEKNHAIEQDNKIYVFNENNLLEFDLESCSFYLLNCDKFAYFQDKFELLCNVPFNNAYYVFYKINLTDNDIKIKHLKKGNPNFNKYSLPFLVFNLIKADFSEAENYISKNIKIENIKKYFKNYSYLLEIDSDFYLLGNNFNKIDFTVSDNEITDID